MTDIRTPEVEGRRVDLFARWLQHAASVVVVISAWCMLALLVWNLDRGLDLTDEAGLLTHYRHPDEFWDHYQQYFRLVRALVPDAFDHAYYYRAFKLIALGGFSVLFSALAVRWIAIRAEVGHRSELHPIVFAHFVLIGSLLAYCHGSQTLSYNDLVTVCLLIVATACFALDCAPARISGAAWRFAISVLVGATIAIVIPVKWPCGPLLAGYFVLFVLTLSGDRSPSAAIASVCGALFGAALLVFTTSDIGIGKVFSYAALFHALWDPNNLEGHNPAKLLRFYAESFGDRSIALLRSPATALLLLLPVVAMFTNARPNGGRVSGWTRFAFAAAILLLLVVFFHNAAGWAERNEQYFFRYNIADLQTFAFACAWVGACAVLLANRGPARRQAAILLGAALLLATLPALGAAGTTNPLLTQYIRHMGLLFAAFAITVAFLARAGRWPPFASLMCAGIAVLSATQLFVTLLDFPYRLAEPGTRQTIALSEPRHLAGLKVDATTATFIGRVRAEANAIAGDTAGLPMLALFDIPGVVFVLDAVSVDYSWHTSLNSEDVLCRRIRSDNRSRGGLPLIALDRELSASLTDCLRAAGIDLADYRERARVQIPGSETSAASTRYLRLLGRKAQ